jgi:capsular polysaccharide biosynthesis protein
LPWLFVIVFFAVVGIGLLRSSADLAVSTTAGLLLAFVISGVADCFLFAATKYPKAPRVFPVVFMTVLLLAGIVRIGSSLDSQDWYRSTARLKVRMTTTDSSTPGSAPAQHAVSRRQFFKDQCEVIRSEKLLRLAAADPELQRLWASMQDRPRSYSSRVSYNASDNQRRSLNSQQQPPKSDAFDSLKQRIAVRPIAGSSLIEIAVISPVAKEAAVIANVLATTYIRNKSEVTTPPQNSIVIEAEVLDRAVPATTALIYYKLSEIVWRLIIVLGLAFAAAGGAARIVSRMISKQRIRAPYWHIQSRFKHRN